MRITLQSTDSPTLVLRLCAVPSVLKTRQLPRSGLFSVPQDAEEHRYVDLSYILYTNQRIILHKNKRVISLRSFSISHQQSGQTVIVLSGNPSARDKPSCAKPVPPGKGEILNITKMLAELRQEQEQIAQAIACLEMLGRGRPAGRGRPPV